MQLSVIKDWQEISHLAPAWNDLLACCSASHVPFLRYEYQEAWWKNLGGGEWQNAELNIIIGYQNNGQIVGIAPFFRVKNQSHHHSFEEIPSLMLLGSIEISDYLDFIVRQPELSEFTEALVDFLDGQSVSEWQTLDLYNIPESSPTLVHLQAASGQRGWKFDQKQLHPCPYIPLPGDWEVYLSGIDKKQRHEIRRKMRRAEEGSQPIRWYVVNDVGSLDSEMEDFLSLMARDPEKDRFLTSAMRSQMHEIARSALKAGWLQLAFLEINGEKAAGYMNFDFAGHIWVYNSGINFDYRELSPGWVLLGYLLKWANENQRESFDFMRGGEDYKYRFGGIDQYIARVTIQR